MTVYSSSLDLAIAAGSAGGWNTDSPEEFATYIRNFMAEAKVNNPALTSEIDAWLEVNSADVIVADMVGAQAA